MGEPGPVEIRAATAADWPAIWACFAPVVAAGETYTIDPAATADEVRELWLEPPPARAFVAVVATPEGPTHQGPTHQGPTHQGPTHRGHSRVVGSAKLRPNGGGPASHVANASFVVDPAYGGRGIGRALGEHVLAAARADGYRAMQFNAVVETNAGAVALWRSLGFRILATVPEAYRHPVHGYVGMHVMHRNLLD